MNDRTGNGTGISKVEVRTNTGNIIKETRYLVRESEMFIEDKTKIMSRVSSDQ